ncbi:MAG TPA: LuxR C-terminal-related transcriptional regulator [Thermoanaerobaculia bacterium]
MNPLTQLRSAIENLRSENLDSQRSQLLQLLESIPAAIGVGDDGHHHRLSPREREVMKMMLEGRRLKEIAAMLDISVKTVTTHRTRLLRKLGLDDNLGLYRYGVRNGLIAV